MLPLRGGHHQHHQLLLEALSFTWVHEIWHTGVLAHAHPDSAAFDSFSSCWLSMEAVIGIINSF